MGISIKNIEPEIEIKDLSSSESQNIVGGKSQYAYLEGVASTPNGSASVSATAYNEGENPYLDIGFSAQVVETEESVVSKSNVFINSGNL